jgi:Na+-driven multidrug efflux pump
MHVLGFAVMLLTYLLIIPYLTIAQPKETRPEAYGYLVFSPFGYLLGLCLFLLPCMLQGESKLTVFVNRVLGAGIWNSL